MTGSLPTALPGCLSAIVPLRRLLNESGTRVAASWAAAEGDVGETSVVDYPRLFVGATPGKDLLCRFVNRNVRWRYDRVAIKWRLHGSILP
ncbi:MAG: hypothetical protein WBN87_18245, partial [Thermoanaerobaculia bacterium]